MPRVTNKAAAMGLGTAWGGHLSCKEEISRVQFPEVPFLPTWRNWERRSLTRIRLQVQVLLSVLRCWVMVALLIWDQECVGSSPVASIILQLSGTELPCEPHKLCDIVYPAPKVLDAPTASSSTPETAITAPSSNRNRTLPFQGRNGSSSLLGAAVAVA